MPRLVALLLASIAVACQSAPPLRSTTPFGVVRAFDEQSVREITQAMEITPDVRSMMESSRDDPIEVWLIRAPRTAGDAFAATSSTRITMGRDSLESPQYYLAHELAHWFTPQSPFDGLPPYVLEGLADFVALRIRGYPDARHKENLLIGTISVPTVDLLATGKAWRDLPTDRSLAASRIGSEVVVQLGLERLKQLAAAHAHPLDYVSEASKVSDEWSWKSQDAEGGQPEDRPPE